LQQLCSSSNGLGTIISYRTGTSCRICEFSPRSACHTKTSNRSVLRRIPANMLRVQWCSFPLSVPALLGFSFLMSSALAECWYNDETHGEGTEVITPEPCLNCTCIKGALLCYLRVCPKLPNPPPPGCILLHRYQSCCPELICTEIFEGSNGLEARSEPDEVDLYDRTALENACVVNGSIYGPGSAMDSSSLCEYCYCLGGKQICVKPKCLLPVEGCVPMYEPTNCCPVHYNCTYTSPTTSSTTTVKTKVELIPDGCVVDGTYYSEGGKVLGVGHSACDNCYCLRGVLRCEPLSCAPPLFGCSPIVRPGECCAASYNCSGAIEIQPEPNFGDFPIVSKEYAKLRKEVHHILPRRNSSENFDFPYEVLPEASQSTTKMQRSPGSFGTTRHFTGPSNPSTAVPFNYNSMAKESFSEHKNEKTKPDVNYINAHYEFEDSKYKKSYFTTKIPRNTESSTELQLSDETVQSIVDSLLNDRLNRRVENGETTLAPDITTDLIQTTSLDYASSEEESGTETTPYDVNLLDFLQTTDSAVTETTSFSEVNAYPVTVKTILNSTDCTNVTSQNEQSIEVVESTTEVDDDNNIAQEKEDVTMASKEEVYSPTTAHSSTEINEDNSVSSTNTILKSTSKSPLEIEAIFNITKDKDPDYEYDYSEPSLPPSLPNLRIIPFVAADAVDAENDNHNIIHASQDRVSDSSGLGYASLFSPPVETEGGFIPKQPPILEGYYDVTMTSTSTTDSPNLHEVSCISDGQEILHGQSIASDSVCNLCTCFYGNIVCQQITCPIPKLECRKSSVQDVSSCCPHYICESDEIPTGSLDRLDGPSNSQEVVTVAEGVNTPNPFRDVIRTEPAPDLQSLIVDMMPFLVRKTSSKSTSPKSSEDGGYLLDKVLHLLLNHNSEPGDGTTQEVSSSTTRVMPKSAATTVSTSTSTAASSSKLANPNENDSRFESGTSGIAILKLAGCNIYGRMYRVGRIISELSNPCLECKCTETGVQCRPLSC
ncbi:unnamed protein product, partial [Tenebrio molitor]